MYHPGTPTRKFLLDPILEAGDIILERPLNLQLECAWKESILAMLGTLQCQVCRALLRILGCLLPQYPAPGKCAQVRLFLAAWAKTWYNHRPDSADL